MNLVICEGIISKAAPLGVRPSYINRCSFFVSKAAHFASARLYKLPLVGLAYAKVHAPFPPKNSLAAYSLAGFGRFGNLLAGALSSVLGVCFFRMPARPAAYLIARHAANSTKRERLAVCSKSGCSCRVRQLDTAKGVPSILLAGQLARLALHSRKVSANS